MLMTTTETVPGYTIERVLGLVEAGSYWGLRPVRGRVTKQAAALGPNAIVGMHYAGGRPSGFSGRHCCERAGRFFGTLETWSQRQRERAGR